MSNIIPPLVSSSPPPMVAGEPDDLEDDEFGDFAAAEDFSFEGYSLPSTPQHATFSNYSSISSTNASFVTQPNLNSSPKNNHVKMKNTFLSETTDPHKQPGDQLENLSTTEYKISNRENVVKHNIFCDIKPDVNSGDLVHNYDNNKPTTIDANISHTTDKITPFVQNTGHSVFQQSDENAVPTSENSQGNLIEESTPAEFTKEKSSTDCTKENSSPEFTKRTPSLEEKSDSEFRKENCYTECRNEVLNTKLKGESKTEFKEENYVPEIDENYCDTKRKGTNDINLQKPEVLQRNEETNVAVESVKTADEFGDFSSFSLNEITESSTEIGGAANGINNLILKSGSDEFGEFAVSTVESSIEVHRIENVVSCKNHRFGTPQFENGVEKEPELSVVLTAKDLPTEDDFGSEIPPTENSSTGKDDFKNTESSKMSFTDKIITSAGSENPARSSESKSGSPERSNLSDDGEKIDTTSLENFGAAAEVSTFTGDKSEINTDLNKDFIDRKEQLSGFNQPRRDSFGDFTTALTPDFGESNESKTEISRHLDRDFDKPQSPCRNFSNGSVSKSSESNFENSTDVVEKDEKVFSINQEDSFGDFTTTSVLTSSESDTEIFRSVKNSEGFNVEEESFGDFTTASLLKSSESDIETSGGVKKNLEGFNAPQEESFGDFTTASVPESSENSTETFRAVKKDSEGFSVSQGESFGDFTATSASDFNKINTGIPNNLKKNADGSAVLQEESFGDFIDGFVPRSNDFTIPEGISKDTEDFGSREESFRDFSIPKFEESNTETTRNLKKDADGLNPPQEESFGDFAAASVPEFSKTSTEVSKDLQKDESFGDFTTASVLSETQSEISKDLTKEGLNLPRRDSFGDFNASLPAFGEEVRNIKTSKNIPQSDSFGDFASASVIESSVEAIKNLRKGGQFSDDHLKTEPSSIKADFKKEVEDDFDDFGEFSDYSTQKVPFASMSSGNAAQNVGNVMKKVFTCEDSTTRDFESTDFMDNEVFKQVQDIENTHALRYHWTNSESQKVLLKALNIDSRNILYGPRWNASMPRFAANLGFTPLEPVKTEINPTSQPQTATSQTEQCEVPAAKFDWTSSGLVNPLDYSQANTMLLDLEQLVPSLDIPHISMSRTVDSNLTLDLDSWDYWLQTQPSETTKSTTEEKPSAAPNQHPETTKQLHVDSNTMQLDLNVLSNFGNLSHSDTESVNSLKFIEAPIDVENELKLDPDNQSLDKEDTGNCQINDSDEFSSFQSSKPGVLQVKLAETYISTTEENRESVADPSLMDVSKGLNIESLKLESTIVTPEPSRKVINVPDYDDDDFTDFQMSLPQKNEPKAPAVPLEPLKPIVLETSSGSHNPPTQINWPEPGIVSDDINDFDFNFVPAEQPPLHEEKKSSAPVEEDDWSDFVCAEEPPKAANPAFSRVGSFAGRGGSAGSAASTDVGAVTSTGREASSGAFTLSITSTEVGASVRPVTSAAASVRPVTSAAALVGSGAPAGDGSKAANPFSLKGNLFSSANPAAQLELSVPNLQSTHINHKALPPAFIPHSSPAKSQPSAQQIAAQQVGVGYQPPYQISLQTINTPFGGLPQTSLSSYNHFTAGPTELGAQIPKQAAPQPALSLYNHFSAGPVDPHLLQGGASQLSRGNTQQTYTNYNLGSTDLGQQVPKGTIPNVSQTPLTPYNHYTVGPTELGAHIPKQGMSQASQTSLASYNHFTSGPADQMSAIPKQGLSSTSFSPYTNQGSDFSPFVAAEIKPQPYYAPGPEFGNQGVFQLQSVETTFLKMQQPTKEMLNTGSFSQDDDDDWSDFVSSQPASSNNLNGVGAPQQKISGKISTLGGWSADFTPNIITNPVHYAGYQVGINQEVKTVVNCNKKSGNSHHQQVKSKSSVPSISALPDLDFIAPKNKFFSKK